MRHLLLPMAAFATALPAQWSPQTSHTTAELRGLSVVSDRVAWASGTRGTVLRTLDGGRTWRADSVPGAAALDFRDVHAASARVAWVMSAGNGAASTIYGTTDGGAHWTRQYVATDSSVFLDAIAFWDARHGLAMGDPIGGRFFLLATDDGGATWAPVPRDGLPDALPGEAAFAASGTCLVTLGTRDAYMATGGGAQARVYHSADRGRTWTAVPTPVSAGNAAAGIFSLAFADARRGVAVGGDYTKPGGENVNVATTADGGGTWSAPGASRPRGYRSGVAYVPGTAGRALVVVGISGSDRSGDGGRSWTPAGDVGYNTVAFAAGGAGWAVGPQGRVARWAAGRAR